MLSSEASSNSFTLLIGSTSDLCYGHGENDSLPFSNFLGAGDTYSNKQFYDFIHPWNDDLPYVFDNYKFDYCSYYADKSF